MSNTKMMGIKSKLESMKLSLRLLRSFIVVAEERHFGRAAERLNLTQPPLSQQMKQLEARLGVKLFDRTTRSVQLTAAGKVLLKQGPKLIADSDDLLLSVRRAAQGKEGSLVIGFVNTATHEVLPRSIAAYREQYADVDLVLKPMHTYLALEELRMGRMDLAFLRLSEATLLDAAFEFHVAAREQMYVALPLGHELAKNKTIPLRALEGIPFVGYAPQDGRYFYEMIMDLFVQNGLRSNIVYESVMPTMFAIVEAGMGLALVPASAARTRRKGLSYRPLRVDGKPVEAVMHVVCRKDEDNPARQAFMEVMQWH